MHLRSILLSSDHLLAFLFVSFLHGVEYDIRCLSTRFPLDAVQSLSAAIRSLFHDVVFESLGVGVALIGVDVNRLISRDC